MLHAKYYIFKLEEFATSPRLFSNGTTRITNNKQMGLMIESFKKGEGSSKKI